SPRYRAGRRGPPRAAPLSRESGRASSLEIHDLPPVAVHGADGGLADQRRRRALRAAAKLQHPGIGRGFAHAVLHELHRLVVLEAEKTGRAHEIALAQAVTPHRIVVALIAEHRPDHGELVGTVRHDLARAERVELALDDE